jgi:hypothetical protein
MRVGEATGEVVIGEEMGVTPWDPPLGLDEPGEPPSRGVMEIISLAILPRSGEGGRVEGPAWLEDEPGIGLWAMCAMCGPESKDTIVVCLVDVESCLLCRPGPSSGSEDVNENSAPAEDAE